MARPGLGVISALRFMTCMHVSYTLQRMTLTVTGSTTMPSFDDRNDACVRRSHHFPLCHFDLRRHNDLVCTVNSGRTSTHQLGRTKPG